MISPDTIQDEVKPEIYYYRVFIRTETDSLSTKNGNQYPIVPGMIATVDIKTGEKTVFDYLMKPINPVLFMRALKVTHFRQLDDPLTVFGLEGTIFGSVFTLSA